MPDQPALPDRAAHVRSALRDTRRGQANEHGFGERMRGHGPRWDSVRQLFDVQCRRLGLDRGEGEELRPLMPAPLSGQGLLFGDA